MQRKLKDMKKEVRIKLSCGSTIEVDISIDEILKLIKTSKNGMITIERKFDEEEHNYKECVFINHITCMEEH